MDGRTYYTYLCMDIQKFYMQGNKCKITDLDM